MCVCQRAVREHQCAANCESRMKFSPFLQLTASITSRYPDASPGPWKYLVCSGPVVYNVQLRSPTCLNYGGELFCSCAEKEICEAQNHEQEALKNGNDKACHTRKSWRNVNTAMAAHKKEMKGTGMQVFECEPRTACAFMSRGSARSESTLTRLGCREVEMGMFSLRDVTDPAWCVPLNLRLNIYHS